MMNYPAVPKRRDEVSILKTAFHHVIRHSGLSVILPMLRDSESFFKERCWTSQHDKKSKKDSLRVVDPTSLTAVRQAGMTMRNDNYLYPESEL